MSLSEWDYDYGTDEEAEARQDARREEFDDAHPPDMECGECGFEWWGNWTRGSHLDPPEPRNPDCPRCNGDVD